MREKNGAGWEWDDAPCCVGAPPRKMAPEKMRIHSTPQVIEILFFSFRAGRESG